MSGLDELEALLISTVRGQLAEPIATFTAALAGYETALIAIIGRLADTGALPIAEAKSALDAAHAGLNAKQKKSGTGTVLRQLSLRLTSPEAPERRRH